MAVTYIYIVNVAALSYWDLDTTLTLRLPD